MTQSADSLLGEGRTAQVFARGDQVLKLYREDVPETVAEREAHALRIIARQGLAAPRVLSVVREGGRWGILMSRLRGSSLGWLIVEAPDRRFAALAAMARLQVRMHGISGDGLPAQHARLHDRIGRAPGLSKAVRDRLLVRLNDHPADDRLCHGDFHPFNLVVPDPARSLEDMGILDWPDATAGTPAADACRTFVLLASVDQALAADWLAAFCTESRFDPATILAWRPIVAAARLAEGIEGSDADRLRRWAAEV